MAILIWICYIIVDRALEKRRKEERDETNGNDYLGKIQSTPSRIDERNEDHRVAQVAPSTTDESFECLALSLARRRHRGKVLLRSSRLHKRLPTQVRRTPFIARSLVRANNIRASTGASRFAIGTRRCDGIEPMDGSFPNRERYTTQRCAAETGARTF